MPTRAHALRIALWYAGVSAVWIVCSGAVLHHFIHNEAWAALVEDVKGWLFVLFTALLLAWVLDRYFQRMRLALEKIEDKEAKLRLVGDNLPESYVIQYTRDPDGRPRFTYMSAGVERVHGLTAAEVMRDASCLLSRVDPAQMPEFLEKEEESARTLCDFEIVLRAKHSRNGTRLFQIRSRPTRNEDGQVLWDGFVTDITKRHQTEEALRFSEAKWRSYIEAAPVGVLVADETGRHIEANRSAEEMLSYEHGGLLGTHVSDIPAKENGPALQQHFEELASTGRAGGQFLLRRKDSSLIWALVRASKLEGGRMLGIFQNVTELKQAEEALRLSEENFRIMFEVALVGMGQAEAPSGLLIRVNRKMCEITGYPEAELLRKTLLEITHPEDRSVHSENYQRLLRGDISDYRLEKRYLRKDGSVVWVNVNVAAIRDAAGHVIRTMGTIEDITERKRLEAQFLQAQKMEAIGKLAGGVAHDFNNILAAIRLHAELGLAAMDRPKEVQEGLEQIRQSAERAANLTRQLLLFSRKQVMQPRDLDLNEVVANMTKMLQRIIGENVRLELHLHAGALMTRADAAMLDQALMNLVVNAGDAMPEGGRLLIETAEKQLDIGPLLPPDAAPGRYVLLSVSDSGCGISPEVLPHVFEPFFTTKPAGKGTGLGLATVFGVVKQHQGWIKVDSQPGHGTTFQICLPASNAPAVTQPAATPKSSGGTETILLVEDDMLVRGATRKLLERAGYKVFEAANGPEALKLWERERQQVRLLVTDLVMPEGMSGQQLAQKIQADRPELKILLCSGYSADIAERGIHLNPGQVFVQKPFSSEQLLSAIRECLDD
jgi:PAS domain S-box-containing protein